MKIERYTKGKYKFPFIAYISDELSENPAIIFQLHGAGERGDKEDELDRVLVNGFANIIDCEDFRDAILIMPQCPKETFWVAKMESLNVFFDEMIALYHADKNRIYLTGLSMGAFGTWYMAMAYPEKFAAIAPCCGGGMPWNAEMIKIPVWAFHGSQDDVVLPSNSIDMVNALIKTNKDVKFDFYTGVGHNSWEKAFSRELLIWLLEQKKHI